MPRTSLSKWYDQSFQKESEVKVGLAKIETTFKELNTFILESIESYTSTIQEAIENQTKKSKARIEAYQQETKSQLDEVVTDLNEEKIGDRMDNEVIEGKIDQDIDEVLTEVFGK